MSKQTNTPNIVFWLIGSNASGKTTQASFLHNFFADDIRQYHEGTQDEISYKFTTYGRISNVGFVKENQCTGTDTLKNKDEVRLSYLKACEKSQMVVVDGIMATYQWLDMFKENNNAFIYVILFDFNDVQDNLLRVRQRKAAKDKTDWKEYVLNDTTVSNVSSKFKGFKSLFNKVKSSVDLNLSVNAMDKKSIITEQIINHLYKNL